MSDTLTKTFEDLDGIEVPLMGIDGILCHQVTKCRYPYEYVQHKLLHRPTEAARPTAAYQRIKERLGDDWYTDVSDDIGLLGVLLAKFIYVDDNPF